MSTSSETKSISKSTANVPYTRTRTGTNSVTMADVAKVAGVSAQTVSRVLRKPEGSAPHIRERVHKAVRETSYVQNLAASNLASNRSMTVAAVIPLISSSIFAETVQGLSNILVPAGYQIIIGHTGYNEDREEAIVRSLLGRRPDAFLLIGTHHTKSTRALLTQAGIPVVETWDWIQKPIDQLVGFSNKDALLELVAYVKQAGYKRPLFLGSILPGDYRAGSRLKGYLEGMAEHYPDAPANTLVVNNLRYEMRTGSELLHTARERFPDTDVMLFSSDLFASGAILECQRLGISVPNELAITGFGDYEIAGSLNPGLTTISVASTAMGEEAANIILRRLSDQQPPKKVAIGFTLMARGSA